MGEDSCDICGAGVVDNGNSLHVWHVEYSCGSKVWGAIGSSEKVIDEPCYETHKVKLF